jgi:hypothetical protein
VSFFRASKEPPKGTDSRNRRRARLRVAISLSRARSLQSLVLSG